MSRIGKLPINLPTGVNVEIDGQNVRVSGPKGELTKKFSSDITIEVKDNQIVVTRASDDPDHRALHGLTRALLANMVKGTSVGFEKKLELLGVGYRAAKSGDNLVLTVGYSHPVEMQPPAGVAVEVPAPNRIVISAIDNEVLGVFAAKVRSVRPPEPYKGKGIRYEGEYVRKKAGKAGIKK